MTTSVLIACDKYKDALSAEAACTIIADTLCAQRPQWALESCPLSDGGEGFAAILTQSLGGQWQTLEVLGPRGTNLVAGFGLVDIARLPAAARALLPKLPTQGRLAVLEMALASGLALLPLDARDTWQADTRGTGQLLQTAAAQADALLLGLGGSATTDLGLGALDALGLQAVTTKGKRLPTPCPAQWEQISAFTGQVQSLPPLYLACDVDNPLLGPRGAAAIYGPQKGLLPADVPRLDTAAARVAQILLQHLQQSTQALEEPGSGAAGGIAFGLRVACGAQLVSGAELVWRWLDLERRLEHCDLVISGEGRLDASSLQGKGPGALLQRASAAGIPVQLFPGAVAPHLALPQGVSAQAISPPGLPLPEALRQAPELLAQAVRARWPA